MAMPQPAMEPDVDRAPRLLAAFWVPVPFMIGVVGSRMLVRYKMRNAGIDDWLMVVALGTQIIALAFLTLSVVNGGGRHVYHLRSDEIEAALKNQFYSIPFAVVASACAKISVATFLTRRVMNPVMPWRQAFLYLNVFIYGLLSAMTIIITYVQCRPVRAMWTPVPDAKCWDLKYSTNLSIAQSAYGSYFDFLLALIPITFLWKLLMSMKRKIAICILLGMGVFGGICAAVKTSQMHVMAHRIDFTWEMYAAMIWTVCEQALVIVCGSIPAIKPLYDYFHSKRPLDGSYASGQTPVMQRRTDQSKSSGSGHRSKSKLALSTFSKHGGETNTMATSGDVEEERLWQSRVGNDRILVGNSYEVSSTGDVTMDRVSTRGGV